MRILDDLNAREDRLRQEIDQLERDARRPDRRAARRRRRSRRRSAAPRCSASWPGPCAAEGPGLHLTVSDPAGAVTAEVLLDAIQELRDAGAEAIMLNDVRIVAASYLVKSGRGIRVDGVGISAPYRFVVVGDPQTLAEAMGIPGGVVDVVASLADARVVVDPRPRVVVDRLASAPDARLRSPVPARLTVG